MGWTQIRQTNLQDIVSLLQHGSFISTQTDHTVGSGYIGGKRVYQLIKAVLLITDYKQVQGAGLINLSFYNTGLINETVHTFNLQHNINGVTLYAGLTQLLHVPQDKSHIGLLVAERLLMILDVLTRRCDLRKCELSQQKAQKSNARWCVDTQAYAITSSSVISIPVTCPLSPTSLLKA